MAHEAAFSSEHSAVSENKKQHQNQGHSTTEDTEATHRNEPKPGSQELQQRLKLADMAPRCRWVRQDGTSCGSPQMKKHIYCFAHMQMAEARTLLLMLPAAEDANAIQVGLMRIQKALIEDSISTKKAGLLLYSMQLALTNVGQTTFGRAKDEQMVRETVTEEEAISNQQSTISENRKPFTTEGTEDTGNNQGSPLMNADNADFGKAGGKHGDEDVEFVPMPGGYGFERVRLRIDPCGHRPRVSPERRNTGAGTEESQGLPLMNADDTDKEVLEKMLPQSADDEVYAGRGPNAEPYNSSLRDERLPKGPRFASEPLDADTVVGSVLRTEPYAVLCPSTRKSRVDGARLG